jgi:predicted transcriptional regulator
MSDSLESSSLWPQARAYLVNEIPGWLDAEVTEALTLPLPNEDWLLEITPDGKLVCMAGYDMEDMKSMLSDGTPEDLGTDELAKQAKFYLQQTVSKHRPKLMSQGFIERIEMNESYVAAHYERPVDFEKLPDLQQQIKTCLTWFPSSV